VFPGEACQLREVRRWLKTFLPECGARDDVITVAHELASNAILHTASGADGKFGIEVTSAPGVICVAVADDGALTGPQPVNDQDSEHGRGLHVVKGLSAHTGVRGGRTAGTSGHRFSGTAPFPEPRGQTAAW
jgi:anti-sigma regulatory factor (Ser/Thr protein kinase)